LPQLVLKDASSGLLDSKGKLWGWRLREGGDMYLTKEQRKEWTEPDLGSIAAACGKEEPVLVTGAELLLVDGPLTFWSVRLGRALLTYDGNTFSEHGVNQDEGRFDGSAVVLGKGWYAFGTSTAIHLYNGKAWTVTRLLEKPAQGGGAWYDARMDFIQDHAGRWFAYYPHGNKAWLLEDFSTKGGKGVAALEAPRWRSFVVSHGQHAVIGALGLDPTGTPERPRFRRRTHEAFPGHAGDRLIPIFLEEPETHDVIPWSVNGRTDHGYRCRELFGRLDGNSWVNPCTGRWEDKDRKVLWLPLFGLWRITANPDEARSLYLGGVTEPGKQFEPAAAHFRPTKVLGRDSKGRLLAAGEHRWRHGGPCTVGIYAFKPPVKVPPRPNP